MTRQIEFELSSSSSSSFSSESFPFPSFWLQTQNSIRGFVRPSIHLSISPLVRQDALKSAETSVLDAFVHVSGGLWVRMGVGCPCASIVNDIVTPRDLL